MNFASRNRTASFRRLSGVLMLALCTVAFAGTAQAGILSLTATQNPLLESSFTLDFGVFGGPRVANISNTQFTLELDPAAPAGLSAAFTSYHQNVDPLSLPNPFGGADLTTGPITISIEESFGGTFNSATGEVTTDDLYRIEFTEDLSSLGIFSPVFLAGTSAGMVNFLTPGSGEIALNWEGLHSIGDLTFSYVCATHTIFTPEPSALALLGLGGLVLRRRQRR